MIFTIISMLILFCGCINFKKGLMLFVAYQIFGYSTRILDISGLSLNTTILLNCGYAFLYLINRSKYKIAKEEFPFKIPFLLTIFSFVITCFFALSGFEPELTRAVLRIMRDYIFIWILWNTIETKRDFKFLFKVISIVMFIGCLYGLFEYIIKDNPLLNYKVVLSSNTINLYDINGPRGYRLTTFFEHPLGAGMTLGLYAVFVFYLWLNNKKMPNKHMTILTAFLCLPCIILTKMRSGILFTIIIAMCLINFNNFRKKRFYYMIVAIIVASPLLYLVLYQNLSIILNLFSVNTSSIGGSSLAMRLNQLEAVVNIMQISPVTGLGETFRAYIVRSEYTDAALGYESIWFEQATMHGIIGLLATVVTIYYSVYKVPKYYKSKPACIFAIAYWIVYTFSSIPSFRIVLFYLAQFYFIKTSEVYRNSKAKEKGTINKYRIKW